MTKLDSEHWSNYWEKGTVTTFFNRFSTNYDGEIKAHWDVIFNRLRNDDCIVDLATGNGALLSLLDESAAQNNIKFKAYGVDFAKLNKKITEKIKSIQIDLIENTMMEETGLQDDSVDLAISQYGFEYSDIEKSVKELDRILKSEATVSFIMHNVNSQIIIDGFNSIKQIEMINDELKVPSIIKKLLPEIEMLKKTGESKHKNKADKLRDELNDAMSLIMQFAETLPDPGYIDFFYKHALSVFKGNIARNFTLQQKLDVIKKVKVETANLKLRMQDLTSVAMDENSNNNLVSSFKSIGFHNIAIAPFWYNKALIGQVLIATRKN